ncbi:hypothetical protein B0T26DRAFT_670209 [Lasiosphaeria miniovina]|uniref:Uncharacterized protein n=1 Tax=Lasiosphaeria miniovina TaxID=1954250 RepID=A0AA40EDV5_9PEZI|nr:uncharacterized protein B0T26DRAFT_670209 [Lasiosphaeria miniovina]KAK0733851.1 hypothetical protein B0T26DRAFT_670209 [Lasiosphaeria miniovina]
MSKLNAPSNVYNCIAYAVNITDRLMLGHCWKELAQKCYYALTSEQLLAAPLQNDDIEARSKVGHDYVIQHDRHLFESTKTVNGKTRRYGTIVTVCRFDAEKEKAYDDQEHHITSSGHPARRKDAVFIWSGEPIPESKARTTMSGRISKSMPEKKPTKAKPTKAAKE